MFSQSLLAQLDMDHARWDPAVDRRRSTCPTIDTPEQGGTHHADRVNLLRDGDLSGWWKALWLVALIVLPFLSALVYLIVRGRGMAERQSARMTRTREDTDAYIRATAGGPTAASQITEAKGLYDAGVIDDKEFVALKEKALG